MSGGALYVYAIVPAPVPAATVAGLAGIDGHAVRSVHAALEAADTNAVAALVHEAQPVPYQGPDESVKRWILEHSQVVEHAWEAFGTVLPVTFNVLVRPEGDETAAHRLGAWLQAHGHPMRERLDRLRGLVELRVEISLDRGAASVENAEVRSLRTELQGKPAGLRRLLEKKVEQVERQAADHLADLLYPEYRRRLAGCVEDLSELRRSASLPASVPVLSAAVLVRRDAVERVGAELAEIQDEQPAARIRFLGPWPPYSFAELSSATWERESSAGGAIAEPKAVDGR